MRLSRLMLVAALTASAGCSHSLGITDPRVIEANLLGFWFQSPTGSHDGGTNLNLVVSDTTITGTGHWFGEAISGGNIVVTGVVNGAQIKLQLAEDNGTTLHFTGHMLNDSLISGEFVGDGAPVAVDYRRSDPAQAE